jgi:hypothetical protein
MAPQSRAVSLGVAVAPLSTTTQPGCLAQTRSEGAVFRSNCAITNRFFDTNMARYSVAGSVPAQSRPEFLT